MNLPIFAGTFAVLLTLPVCGEELELSELYRLTEAAKFVFVEEVRVGKGEFDDKWGYKETDLKGATKGDLDGALKTASKQRFSPDGSYPLIGVLGRVMLLDSDGIPICTMEVVNWDRTVVFIGVDPTGGKNFITDDPWVQIRSEAISRWVYDQMRKNLPEELKRMQENYQRVGQNLETLLFPDKNDSEQDGADQPAVAPESKSEDNKKPQPESNVRPQ